MNEGRTFLKLVVVFTVLLLLPIGVFAQDNELGVRSADIEVTLQEDGSLSVTENLVYDLGEMPQTGFVRRLTAPANGSIEINSVYRDGLEDDYKTTQAGKTKRVIIGTEGVEITGEHKYRISYTMNSTVVSGNGTAQLVWPVVDNAGIVAENITINLSSPLDVSRVSCRIEPKQQGCPVTKVDTGYRAQLDELPADKRLIIQANLSADQITNELPEGQSNRLWGSWLASGIAILIIIILLTYKRRSSSENNEEKPVPEHIDSLS